MDRPMRGGKLRNMPRCVAESAGRGRAGCGRMLAVPCRLASVMSQRSYSLTSGDRLMIQVRELLQRKGHHVLTINPAASVLQAAVLMNEHRVGALVAVEGGRVA